MQEALDKDGDFLKEIVGRIVQQLMEEERDQQVGVLSHQRDDYKRKATRNGYKARSFHTRTGSLLLAKPQIREFAFHTQLFENYQRSEKALLPAICQMVKDGVSTNRVKKIVGRLSPNLCYSKSTVIRLTQELDPQIRKWREEKLKDHYVYMITDAVYFFLRENRQVVSRPVLVAEWFGGGIRNSGGSTITGTTISGNHANYGGGIINSSSGTLTITNSTISDNDVDEHAGGIYNLATLNINNSTISGNDGDEYGGGIYNSSDGTLTITGSTISGNHAINGGGIYLYSETNVTIGGSSDTDLANFNDFTNNYKTGTSASADQHIRKYDATLVSIDCHANFLNNNFTPGP